MRRAAFIAETIAMLQERYGATAEELLDAMSGDVSIPANVFSSTLTPWEAACTYLHDRRGLALTDIAAALGRSPSSVSNALRNAQYKGVALPDAKAGLLIPTTVFRETDLPPLQAVVFSLNKEYGLEPSQIASIIDRESSNVHNALKKAREAMQ